MSTGKGLLGAVRIRTVLAVPAALAALVALAGCASVVEERAVGALERWTYTVREAPDGRQEGKLSYRGKTVGSRFSTIVVEGYRFELRIRTEEEPFEGYRLQEQRQPTPSSPGGSTSERAGEEQTKRGWYLAGFGERLAGTPDDWVWVQRENLTAWVDPGELGDLASRYDLAPILGEAQDEVSIGVGFTTIFRF